MYFLDDSGTEIHLLANNDPLKPALIYLEMGFTIVLQNDKTCTHLSAENLHTLFCRKP